MVSDLDAALRTASARTDAATCTPDIPPHSMESLMPLARIDLKRGKPAAYRKAIRDGVYEPLRPAGIFAGRGSVVGKLADMAQHTWSRYWARRGERAAIALLQTLDDRALKDIGLDRS